MTFPLSTAITTLLALCAMSIMTGVRLADATRLPMPWSSLLHPRWSVPRGLALAFAPALATVFLTCALFPVVMNPADAGWVYCGGMAVVCVGLILAHALYLAALPELARHGGVRAQIPGGRRPAA